MTRQYNIICNGDIDTKFSRDQVAQNLSNLFKIPAEKVADTFFSGTAFIVKKKVDHETAEKYVVALKKAGVCPKVEPVVLHPQNPASGTHVAVPEKSAPDTTPVCPKCGFQENESSGTMAATGECPACGVVLAKYNKFYETPEAHALQQEVETLFGAVSGESGVFVHPHIPATKMANAAAACELPSQEKILGLVDLTVMGSATDCLVAGIKGIYFHNPAGTKPRNGMIPYAKLPERSISNGSWMSISLGAGEELACSGATFPLGRIIGLLETLQQVAIKNTASQTPDREVIRENNIQPASPGMLSRENLLALLRQLKSQDGVYIVPKIPEKKRVNAAQSCGIPPRAEILGLVDCTVMGSAKNGLVFCNDAIYYHNSWETKPEKGRVPYAQFPERTFSMDGKYAISLGKGDCVGFSGSPVPIPKAISLLQCIKAAMTGEDRNETDPMALLLAPRCPKCGSATFELGQTGYSWGAGIATTLFFGPLAGHIAASAREGKMIFVCKTCGKKWKPSEEEVNRVLAQIQEKVA